ncbi:MAG: SDR family oxidoreductase [Erysipelotrichaceae bacterium]|nr:SDR family oxidoreductase [Erysipelotrichaceae bacterium]
MKVPFNIDLENKVIVITGAGGVLCGAFAEALGTTKAKIALLGLHLDKVVEKSKVINSNGGISKGYQCNVLDKDSIIAARNEIVKDFGTCDILINGAGGNNPKATTDNEYFKNEDLNNMMTFFDLDQSGVEYVFNLNYMGTLLPTQVFAQDMLNKEGCSIINISSMNAFTPLTKIPAYSGAKAAVSNFTMWLAVHFSKVGIRCNAIAPGFFATKQNAALLFNEDGSPTKRTQKILDATPMNRFGETQDLIGTLFYLVSPEASGFVNGVVIPVDGGFSAYSGV